MAENIQVKIGADVKGLQNGMSKGQQAVQKFGQAAERASQGIRSTLYGVMSSHPYLMAIGGAILAIGSAISALHSRVKGLDALAKQAKSVNLTTDAYQELAMASNLAGVQMEKVLGILNRIDSAVTQGATGTEKYAKAFETLGLSIKKVESLAPQERIYALLEARKIHGENSETNKALLDIIGLRNMQDFRKMEKSDFTTMAAYASSAGDKVSAKQIELAEAYSDAIALEGQHMKAVIENSKMLEEYTKAIQKYVNRLQGGDEWDAPISESNPLSQKKYNEANVARDKLREAILSGDPKVRAEFERLLSEQLGPTYTGGVGNVAAGQRAFTDEQIRGYLQLNENGSILNASAKQAIRAMLKEPDWLGYDPASSENMLRRYVDKEGATYQSTPEEIAYANAQLSLEKLGTALGSGSAAKDIALTTEAVNDFIKAVENLNGVKMKQEDIDALMKSVDAARLANINAYIMDEAKAIRLGEREVELNRLKVMGENERAEVLKKIYDLQDRGLATAAKIQGMSYNEALAAKRDADNGLGEFQSKEGISALNQRIAEIEQNSEKLWNATVGGILDELKKIEATKLPALAESGRDAWVAERMKPLESSNAAITESGKSELKAELEALYDLENFFVTSAKDFNTLTNELTSKGGWLEGAVVQRNNSQEVMQQNVARLRELVSTIKTDVQNSARTQKDIADALI